MPKIYITVYRNLARDSVNTPIQIPQTPPLSEDAVEIQVTPNQSQPFPTHATFITVKAEIACWLAFGEDPIAKVGEHPVDANEKLWYGVTPGQRLSVVESSDLLGQPVQSRE